MAQLVKIGGTGGTLNPNVNFVGTVGIYCGSVVNGFKVNQALFGNDGTPGVRNVNFGADGIITLYKIGISKDPVIGGEHTCITYMMFKTDSDQKKHEIGQAHIDGTMIDFDIFDGNGIKVKITGVSSGEWIDALVFDFAPTA